LQYGSRIQTETTGRTKRQARKRLFGFRNRKFAACPVKQEAYTISALTLWNKGMYLEHLRRVLDHLKRALREQQQLTVKNLKRSQELSLGDAPLTYVGGKTNGLHFGKKDGEET
jgi:hypothetical protein